MQHDASVNRRRIIRVAVICISLVSLLSWRIASQKASPDISLQKAASPQAASPLLRQGLGAEVQFAAATTSQQDVRASVESVDKFIAARSGLQMSEETKARLIAMEQDSLKSKSGRISIATFVNALTDTFVDSLASLKDRDVEIATARLQVGGTLSLRSDGKLNLGQRDFAGLVNALRDRCRQKDAAARSEIYGAIKGEVDRRIQTLSAGVPEQFGGAATQGLTPLRAILVAYSLVADDPLELSKESLDKIARSPILLSRNARGIIPLNAKAYGSNGRLFASPTQIIFSKVAIGGLLDRLAKGGN